MDVYKEQRVVIKFCFKIVILAIETSLSFFLSLSLPSSFFSLFSLFSLLLSMLQKAYKKGGRFLLSFFISQQISD